MSLDTSLLGGPYVCVFDVGAFRGDFAAACLAAWPDCRVECFEPLEQQPDLLPPNVRWHPYALGARNSRVPMYECEFIPSSSILEMREEHKSAFPYTRRNTMVEIEMRTLLQYGGLIDEPALLKIDTQGGELEVLRGAEEDLALFKAVVLEVSHVPLYEGVPSFEDLDGYLASWGFKHAHRVDELRHPVTDELLQSDEFFVR